MDDLHAEHFHLMISIWPFFEPGSANYDYMEKQGWFVDKFKFAKPPITPMAWRVYDATNPEARKYYWDQVNKALVQHRRSMPGGWIQPSRKPRDRKKTSCSITNWRQGAAIAM